MVFSWFCLSFQRAGGHILTTKTNMVIMEPLELMGKQMKKKHERSRLPDFTRLSITCLGLSFMLILSYAVITLLHKLKIHRTVSQQDVVEHQPKVSSMHEKKLGKWHRSYNEKDNSIYMCMPDKLPAQGAGHDL